MRLSLALKLALLLSNCVLLSAQTTQGLIAGKVVDELNLAVIAGAHITLSSPDEGARLLKTETDTGGYFSFASLAPGTYNLRIIADSYRASEVRKLVLPVSGLLIQNVRLRLLTDIWQTGILRSAFASNGSILPVYGPDVDLSRSAYIERSPEKRGELAPSLSRDISSKEMLNLPLRGRDPYALVVLQPNVTSDITTQRGLGVSANGQRPSSTAFLLDGFQNNNYLTTGVFAVLPPEAIQEYRLSMNNFSAEFGGTAGYLANAITRSGSNARHGQLYADVTNQSWNAVDPQETRTGGPALPSQQFSVGAVLGGSLVKNRLFTTSTFGWDRSHSSAEQNLFTLPTEDFLQRLQNGSAVARLISQFAAPIPIGSDDFGSLLLRPTVSLDHFNALERLDFISKDEKSHSFARLIADRLSQPDFIWSPYSAFTSGLDRSQTGVGLSTSITPRPNRLYEFRVGYTQDSIGWNRTHPEIPSLEIPLSGSTYRFGSPASYTFHDDGKTIEAASNLAFTNGPHSFKWGASYLARWPETDFSTPNWPIAYTFLSTNSDEQLVSGTPSGFRFSLSRAALRSGNLVSPELARNYRYWQFAGYVQDSYRLSERFLLHVGLRYEYFSPPANTGPYKDTTVQLGSGASMPGRIQDARMLTGQQIYDSDFKNWAPRLGFAYDITNNGGLILRASYGIFYDRPFDNLWLNTGLNDALPASADVAGLPISPLDSPAINLQKVSQALSIEQRARLTSVCNPETNQGLPSVTLDCTSIDQTLFQPRFRSPYVQSFFGGLQKRINNSIAAEVEYAGSLGRELVTTDIINRSVHPCTQLCRYNNQFDDLDYRANQGSATHHALVSSLSIRMQRLLLDFNYTWSHTIDNQSEPLAGFAANLAEVNLTGRPIPLRQSAFTREFDSGVDRGNSNFDQRHVAASYFTWFVPSFLQGAKMKSAFRDWVVAGVSAIRSGSPFTVYARVDSDSLVNNRSDLVDPMHAGESVPYPGGRLILNSDAFRAPVSGSLGTAGRNAFYGPGAYNVDLSLARRFVLPFSEEWRLMIRADAFNLFNHANLSNPVNGHDSCCPAAPEPFGLAMYGRNEASTGLPVSTPLSETARQFHFVMRLTF